MPTRQRAHADGRCYPPRGWHGRKDSVSDIASGDMGPWLAPDQLDHVRRKVPMVYVTAVPVRLDTEGRVESVGTLLRATSEGSLRREIVSGRVLFHEPIRSALMRHIERDMGGLALPMLPASPTPFTVAEFFPVPGEQGYHDERQHAVALCYVIPVSGECTPHRDVLELAWLTPQDLRDPDLLDEFVDGHAEIVRQALAHTGVLVR